MTSDLKGKLQGGVCLIIVGTEGGGGALVHAATVHGAKMARDFQQTSPSSPMMFCVHAFHVRLKSSVASRCPIGLKVAQ